MAKKLRGLQAEAIGLSLAVTLHVPEDWFDGDVWEITAEDYKPLTAEVARQKIRTEATKRDVKIVTKIREGVIYIQAIPRDMLLNEQDSKGGEVTATPAA